MDLDADSWARVLYLGLLLAFVGFFLLGQRHRIGRSLRDLVVWALIFAMVVIAYGFRGVLREELLPAAMVSRPDGSIELRRASAWKCPSEARRSSIEPSGRLTIAAGSSSSRSTPRKP